MRSAAATTDVAAASVDPPIALVGAPVTFPSAIGCSVVCSLTWRRPDIGIARFGGVIVGQGQQITLTFADPGTYELVLDMGEACDGTSRLVCHSYAFAFVDVVTTLPTDPAAVPVDTTPQVDPAALPA